MALKIDVAEYLKEEERKEVMYRYRKWEQTNEFRWFLSDEVLGWDDEGYNKAFDIVNDTSWH